MNAEKHIVPEWRRSATAGVTLAIARATTGSEGTAKNEVRKQAERTIIRPQARDRWMGAVASSYTPERIESVLRSVASGDLAGQWELFDLMEDTWPRLAKNLNELKRAVKSFDRTFLPWAEEDEPPTDEAQERAKLVSRALWTMRPKADEVQNGFDDTIYDILDAWGKGSVVLEVDWETRGAGKIGEIFAPKATRWIHPRFYGWSSEDWLGLRVAEVSQRGGGAEQEKLQAVDGIFARFPAHKFLVCTCKAKTGHPTVTALLRPLAFWWAASNFTQEWFLNFAQIFGLPIRWANYDSNVPGLVDQVADMLENMGSTAWAAFPQGTTLELKETAKAGTDNPQVALLDRADRQCDILILGQTLTTDVSGSGSRALGEVQYNVRGDILRAASDFVAMVINQQLIPSVVALNYGEPADDVRLAPELILEPAKQEDAQGNAERDAILLRNPDVKMPRAWFYKRHNIPLPQPDEDVIAGSAAAAGAQQMGPMGQMGPIEPNPEDEPDDAKARGDERLVENVLENLTKVEARWLGGVKPFFAELVAKAQNDQVSDAEFVEVLTKAQRRFPELFGKLDSKAVEDALFEAMSAAAVNGAVRRGLQSARPGKRS